MAHCLQQVEMLTAEHHLTVSRVDKVLASQLRQTLDRYLEQRRDTTLCLVRRVDGWLWLADYVGEATVILFFWERDTEVMFYVTGKDPIDVILGEIGGCTPSFVTDETGSFLFEWSHEYDQLVAYKGAIDWLHAYAQTHDQPLECYNVSF